jgi:hypothetical protein
MSGYTRFREDGWPHCPACDNADLWCGFHEGWPEGLPTPPLEVLLTHRLTCHACGWTNGVTYPPQAEGDDLAEGDDADDPGELARRAFHPEGFIDVVLPSGAVACVSPGVSPETLDALDRLARLAAGRVSPEGR